MKGWFSGPRMRTLLVALLAWIMVLLVMQFLPMPYVRMSPGPMYDVLGQVDGKPVIDISGAETFPTSGQLSMTTVAERGGPYGALTLVEAYAGWLRDGVAIVPTDVLFPPDTNKEQATQAGVDQFELAEQSARIAALREVGEPVTTRPEVASVEPGSPAEGRLQVSDVILRVNGRPVSLPSQVSRRVRVAGPGADVRLLVRRGDEVQPVTVRTIANPDDPDAGYLKVLLITRTSSPVEVEFNLSDIGGPSAGLVLALGIVDKLTPGSLLQGAAVAGTGTLDDAGRVGPIGGIEQKMAAARKRGVGLFLAPKGNCPQVLGHEPEGVQVVPVATLHEARQVLESYRRGVTQFAACR